MVENIEKIIKNGFETYTKNLNLGIPFVINLLITGLLAVLMLGLGLIYIFGSSLSSLENASPEKIIAIILPLISQHLFEIAVLIAVYIFISLFSNSFFTAGAIGMAKQATETGKSDLSAMMEAGKKNVVNLYLAEILAGLLYLAGVVFIVPGAMKTGISQLISSANTGAIILLIGGFLLWMVYILILSLILAVFMYALIIDNLGPIDGITTGLRFFYNHKFDVFLLWLITGAVVIVVAVIGQVVGAIPVLNNIWPFINVLISVLIIAPLTTVWGVRLYMARTGKKLYFNELLAHPCELEKL